MTDIADKHSSPLPETARIPRRQFICLLIIAVFVSIIIQQDYLLRHFHSSPEKIGVPIASPREDLGDNYYYMVALKRAPELFSNAVAASFGSNEGSGEKAVEIGAAYIGALLVGHAFHTVSEAVTPTSRDAAQLTLVLQTASTLLAFLWVLAGLLRPDERPRLFGWYVIGFVSAAFLTAFSTSAYLGELYIGYSRLLYYPDLLRLINPTMFWAWALVLLFFLLRVLEARRPWDFATVFLLAVPAGFFGMGVTVTLAGAVGVYALAEWAIKKRFPLMPVALGAVLCGSLVLALYYLHLFHATPIGSDLQTGSFQGLKLRWHFLFLLLLVFPLKRALPGPRGDFMIALLATSVVIGLVCDSVHLGDRLWLRGSAVFVWLVVIFLTIKLVRYVAHGLQERGPSAWTRIRGLPGFAAAARVTFVAASVVFVYGALAPDMQKWRGFIDRDKWDILEWIDKHIASGQIIASPNIEDSYLVPIYTRARPLAALYGLTSRSVDEVVTRYFYSLIVAGVPEGFLEKLLTVTDQQIHDSYKEALTSTAGPVEYHKYQRIAFYTALLYYPFNQRFEGILKPGPAQESFRQYLRTLYSRAQVASFRYDFVVLSNADGPSRTPGWVTVYRNATYSLFRHDPGSR